MTTILGEKLSAAQEAKSNDIKSFIWKGPRKDFNGMKVQTEIKMIDASEEQLQEFYNHCNSMLRNNTNKEHPGRYCLLDIIKDQRERCNTELYLRFLEKDDILNHRERYPRIDYFNDLRNTLNKEENQKACPKNIWNEVPIMFLTNGIPAEFKKIPLSLVMEGCVDCLGRFDKSHITLNFITKLGVWFKTQEMKTLNKKDEEGNTLSRLDVAEKMLGLDKLNKPMHLHINPKGGLSFTELESLVKLKSKKYSELTTDQLTLLRNKILFKLEDEVLFHISQWKERIKQIQKVAKYKGFELKYNPDDEPTDE